MNKIDWCNTCSAASHCGFCNYESEDFIPSGYEPFEELEVEEDEF